MDCSHSKWTSANSVFRFRTRCELCETKMMGIFNTAQCSDCGRYMHDSCAAALKQILACFKTTESKTDTAVASKDEEVVTAGHVIVGRAGETARESKNGVSVRVSAAVRSDETATGQRTTAGSDPADRAGRETFCRAEGYGVSTENDVREARSEPVRTTAAAAPGRSGRRQSPDPADDTDRVHVDADDGPNVWNPIRVGPPLLIPIDGGPILVTPPHDGQSEFDPIYYGLEIPRPVRADPPPIWNPVRVGPPLLIPINGGPILVTPLE